MEKFKKKLQTRLALSALYSAVILTFLVLGVFRMTNGSNGHISDFISGFNFGGCIGVQCVMLYFMGKYIGALKSEEKLKQLYIEEHDERNLFIAAKIGGAAVNLIIGGLALGTIAAGYINETAFFVMLAAVIFSVFVKLAFKLYYRRAF